jgi:hypothetical protein
MRRTPPEIHQIFGVLSGVFEGKSGQQVKFPKRLRQSRVLATIYKRPDCYRLLPAAAC